MRGGGWEGVFVTLRWCVKTNLRRFLIPFNIRWISIWPRVFSDKISEAEGPFSRSLVRFFSNGPHCKKRKGNVRSLRFFPNLPRVEPPDVDFFPTFCHFYRRCNSQRYKFECLLNKQKPYPKFDRGALCPHRSHWLTANSPPGRFP